jgi:hypothetical protein
MDSEKPAEAAGSPTSRRLAETATPYIPGGTPEEERAFGFLVAEFPQSTVGEFIPNGETPKQSVLEQADEELADPEGTLVPLDFERLLAEGVPEPDYLDPPYIIRGARVWAFGAAESAKSIYFQHLAAKVTRKGRIVTFVSAENPLVTDLDRMNRLRPDFKRLRYFHMPALDLNEREDFLKLAEACGDADVIVLDTLTALWSGDENSNREIVTFDRDVLVPLVRLTGAAVIVIHHTGHPQAFISRGGANAGRGASAMGQKADIILVFAAGGPHEFTVDHGKNRTPGGLKEPKARFRVVDTEGGGLEIERAGRAIDPRVAEAMDVAVEVISSADGMGTNALKAALGERGFGGSTVTPALAELRQEDPPRVRQVDGTVIGTNGRRQKGKPWVIA